MGLTGAKIKVLAGPAFLLETQWKNPFPCLFSFESCIPWLAALPPLSKPASQHPEISLSVLLPSRNTLPSLLEAPCDYIGPTLIIQKWSSPFLRPLIYSHLQNHFALSGYVHTFWGLGPDIFGWPLFSLPCSIERDTQYMFGELHHKKEKNYRPGREPRAGEPGAARTEKFWVWYNPEPLQRGIIPTSPWASLLLCPWNTGDS